MDGERTPVPCAACGSADTHVARVRSAFWDDDRLVVVEDIPAIVCGACREESYDDATVVQLDLLRGEGFPAEKARTELRVPVFSLGGRTAPERAP